MRGALFEPIAATEVCLVYFAQVSASRDRGVGRRKRRINHLPVARILHTPLVVAQPRGDSWDRAPALIGWL